MKTKFYTLLTMGALLITGAANAQFNEDILNPIKSPANRPSNPFESVVLGHPVAITQDADTVTAGAWINKEKYVSPKNSNGHFTEFAAYQWDTSGKWATEVRLLYSYAYDGSNNLTAARQVIMQNDTPTFIRNWAYTLNGSGKPVAASGTDSMRQGAAYIGIPKTDSFYYDGTGNYTEYISYYGISPFKQYQARSTYAYNTSNQVTDQTSYRWSNNSWEGDVRWVYAYSGTQMISALELSFDGSVWDSATMEYYTYDGTGKLSAIEQYSYDMGSSSWMGESKNELTYTGNLLTEAIVYEWVANAWVREDKAVATYTGTTPNLVEMFGWNGTAFATTPNARIIYTDLTTGIGHVSATSLEAGIYPNPASGMLMVSYNGTASVSMQVMDMNGRIVMNNMNVTAGVDISSLNNGLYMVILNDGAKSIVHRMIKN